MLLLVVHLEKQTTSHTMIPSLLGFYKMHLEGTPGLHYCCCSPSSSNVAESLSTLRFGTRAKHIKASPRPHCNKDHYAKNHGASHATKDESMERILNKGIFFDPNSIEELEQALEDVTTQTISALHQAVEDLVCTTELKCENKALKARVTAAEKLNALQTEAVENGNTNVLQKISDLLSLFVSRIRSFSAFKMPK